MTVQSTPPPHTDFARIVALVLGSFTIAVVGVVFLAYLIIYVKHLRALRAGTVEAWYGLLPRHVALVAASMIGLVASTMYEVATRLRQDFTWWAPAYAFLYALALAAMWDVLGHSRHRTRDLDARRLVDLEAGPPKQPPAGPGPTDA